jgi:hypothetical protein
MGLFHEQIQVVNRTCKTLSVRFDGQDMEIPAGYNEKGERLKDVVSYLPKVAMFYALNQNPVMGTEDPMSPSHFDSKIGFVEPKAKKTKWYHEISFVPDDSGELTRVRLREYLEDDPQVKDIVVRGRRLDGAVALPRGGTFDVQERG